MEIGVDIRDSLMFVNKRHVNEMFLNISAVHNSFFSGCNLLDELKIYRQAVKKRRDLEFDLIKAP